MMFSVCILFIRFDDRMSGKRMWQSTWLARGRRVGSCCSQRTVVRNRSISAQFCSRLFCRKKTRRFSGRCRKFFFLAICRKCRKVKAFIDFLSEVRLKVVVMWSMLRQVFTFMVVLRNFLYSFITGSICRNIVAFSTFCTQFRFRVISVLQAKLMMCRRLRVDIFFSSMMFWFVFFILFVNMVLKVGNRVWVLGG